MKNLKAEKKRQHLSDAEIAEKSGLAASVVRNVIGQHTRHGGPEIRIVGRALRLTDHDIDEIMYVVGRFDRIYVTRLQKRYAAMVDDRERKLRALRKSAETLLKGSHDE